MHQRARATCMHLNRYFVLLACRKRQLYGGGDGVGWGGMGVGPLGETWLNIVWYETGMAR